MNQTELDKAIERMEKIDRKWKALMVKWDKGIKETLEVCEEARKELRGDHGK